MSAVRFGVVGDEISDNVHTACKTASRWGMEYIELNSAWGKEIHLITDEEAEKILHEVEQFGLRVNIVLISLFKPILIHELEEPSQLEEFSEFQEHLSILDRGLELCHLFGANLLRTFSFRRPEGDPFPIREGGGKIPDRTMRLISYALKKAVERAASKGCLIALENVRSCYGNTGLNAAAIMEATGDEIKTIWDPANALVSGGTVFPEDYEAVRDRIVDIHLKDAVIEDSSSAQTRWECIGKGQLDYTDQFAAFLDDGLTESWTLETHFKLPDGTPMEASRLSFDGMESILASLNT